MRILIGGNLTLYCWPCFRRIHQIGFDVWVGPFGGSLTLRRSEHRLGNRLARRHYLAELCLLLPPTIDAFSLWI